MGKFRFRACLDQALFLLLIVAGVLVSAVLGFQGVMEVATATSRHATVVAKTAGSPPAPMTAASGTRPTPAGTLLARLLHWSSKPPVRRT
jgi:hypothetical protein